MAARPKTGQQALLSTALGGHQPLSHPCRGTDCTCASLVVLLREPSTLPINLLSGRTSREGGRKGIKLFRNVKLLRQFYKFPNYLDKLKTSTAGSSGKTCSTYNYSQNTFTALEYIKNRMMNNSDHKIIPLY